MCGTGEGYFKVLILWWPENFENNFSVKVLDKLPFMWEIHTEKSYLNFFNGNEDIGDLRFVFFSQCMMILLFELIRSCDTYPSE